MISEFLILREDVFGRLLYTLKMLTLLVELADRRYSVVSLYVRLHFSHKSWDPVPWTSDDEVLLNLLVIDAFLVQAFRGLRSNLELKFTQYIL